MGSLPQKENQAQKRETCIVQILNQMLKVGLFHSLPSEKGQRATVCYELYLQNVTILGTQGVKRSNCATTSESCFLYLMKPPRLTRSFHLKEPPRMKMVGLRSIGSPFQTSKRSSKNNTPLLPGSPAYGLSDVWTSRTFWAERVSAERNWGTQP